MYNLPLVTLFYLIKISACETSLDFQWSHEMGCQIKYKICIHTSVKIQFHGKNFNVPMYSYFYFFEVWNFLFNIGSYV